MSKAFDSIQRNTLIEDLKNAPKNLIRILLDVKIVAKCGNYKVDFSARTKKHLKEIVQAPVGLLFS